MRARHLLLLGLLLSASLVVCVSAGSREGRDPLARDACGMISHRPARCTRTPKPSTAGTG
jgi:hypothetical protein